MTETRTNFAYLGNRDYVHGTSVLIGMLEALETEGAGAIRLRRLKFHRASRSNGVIRLARDAGAPFSAETANCTLSADVDGARWHGAFIEQGVAVSGRTTVDYRLANMQGANFSATCDIEPANRDDLIRAIIEANKRSHEISIEPQAGAPLVRFGYLEDWTVPRRDVGFSGRLEVRNLIAQKTATGYRTINRITYAPAGGGDTTLTLCFDVELPPADAPT